MDPRPAADATPAAPPPPPGRAGAIVWPAVAVGAGIGLGVLIVVATVRAVLDRRIEDFDQTGWTVPLLLLLVAGYALAGWVAQRRAAAAGTPDAPFAHGALAGVGAFVAWIPLRFLIWLVRGEHRGLFRGGDAALRPGQVLGALVIAAGLGMLGGYVAARSSRAATDA